jgi:hypothetical protein
MAPAASRLRFGRDQTHRTRRCRGYAVRLTPRAGAARHPCWARQRVVPRRPGAVRRGGRARPGAHRAPRRRAPGRVSASAPSPPSRCARAETRGRRTDDAQLSTGRRDARFARCHRAPDRGRRGYRAPPGRRDEEAALGDGAAPMEDARLADFGDGGAVPGPLPRSYANGAQHTTRQASSRRCFFSVLNPSARACGQNWAGLPWYSTWKTAFRARTKGARAPHS